MGKRSHAQDGAPSSGTKGEQVARKWLESHFFKCQSKSSKDPCDIIAGKKGKTWAIEVKTGNTRPGINLHKFFEMYEGKYDVLGLALVIKNEVFLLQLVKASHRATKAWDTIRGYHA